MAGDMPPQDPNVKVSRFGSFHATGGLPCRVRADLRLRLAIADDGVSCYGLQGLRLIGHSSHAAGNAQRLLRGEHKKQADCRRNAKERHERTSRVSSPKHEQHCRKSVKELRWNFVESIHSCLQRINHDAGKARYCPAESRDNRPPGAFLGFI
jgi:hypothetical protein